jgi:hypothetical protein
LNISDIYAIIQIKFPTTNTNNDLLWKVDLGTGLSSNSDIPCKGLLGLKPVTGNEVTCKFYPASSVAIS